MKKRIITLLCLLAIVSWATVKGQNPIIVTIDGTTLGDYATLNTAYAALTTSNSTGKDVVFNLTNNAPMSYLDMSGKGWNSLTIQGNGKTISSASYLYLHDINNVNIIGCILDIGDGTQSFFIGTSVTNITFSASTLNIKGTYGLYFYGPSINNIAIRSSTLNCSGTNGIYFLTSASNTTIDNCTFNIGGTYGINIPAAVTNTTVKNSVFTQSSSSAPTASAAIYMGAGATNTRIIGNKFRNMLRTNATTNVITVTNTSANTIIIDGNSFYETGALELPTGWSRYVYIGGGVGGGTSVTDLRIKNNYFGSTAERCEGNVLTLGTTTNVTRNFICIETSTLDAYLSTGLNNVDSIIGNTFAKITMTSSSDKAPDAGEEKRGALTAYANYFAGFPQIIGNRVSDFTLKGNTNNVYLVGFGHTGGHVNFENNIITNLTTENSTSTKSGSISVICLGAINMQDTDANKSKYNRFRSNTIDGLTAKSTSTENVQELVGIRFTHYGGRHSGNCTYEHNNIKNFDNKGTTAAHYISAFSSEDYGNPYRFVYMDNTIDNLKLSATSSGISSGIKYTKAGTTYIANNKISNMSIASATTGALYGIYTPDLASNDSIVGNRIYNLAGPNNSSAIGVTAVGGVVGIRTTNNAKVYKNFVLGLVLNAGGNGYVRGIVMAPPNGTSGSHSIVYNNIVSLCNSDKTQGILNYGTYSDFYYNTVIVNSTNAASAAFLSTADNTTAANNIFDNRGSGYGLYTTAATTVNNNIYYANNGTAYSNNGTISPIPQVATNVANPLLLTYKGGDAASICSFDTIIDFQVFDFEKQYKGAQISGVTTDIWGYTRNNPAQIGAWEKTPNVWKGTNTTAWDTNTNWLSQTVPGTNEDIYFASDASNNLYVQGTKTQGSIYRQTSTKNLIVPAGTSLKITGKMEGFDENSFTIASESGTSGNGIFIYPQSSTVRATVEMFSKAFSPAGVTINTANWQYFGIPVSSYPANQMHGLNIRRYDETMADDEHWWQALTNADTMYPSVGYEVTKAGASAGFTMTFKGELVNSNLNIPITYTENTDYAGQMVVSNPYTAPLSIATGIDFGTGMEQTVYLFNTGSSTQWGNPDQGSAGQYISIPQLQTTAIGTDFISSMQGFVVKTRGSVPSNIMLKYSGVSNLATNMPLMRTIGRTASSEKTYTKIVLSDSEGDKDVAWLFVDADATRGFDNGYDGRKLFGNARLAQLYMPETDGNYQVNTVPEIEGTYLSVKPAADITDYTLAFTHAGYDANTRLILRDLLTGTETDITQSGSEYQFQMAAADAAGKRFRLISISAEVDPTANPLVDIYYQNNIVTMQNRATELAGVVIYDAVGRRVATMTIPEGDSKILSASLSDGIYIAKITVGTVTKSQQIIVR